MSIKIKLVIFALYCIFLPGSLLSQGLQEHLSALDRIKEVSTVATDSFLNEQALKRFQRIRIVPGKVEPTYRAAKALMANIEEGISYKPYIELVQSLVSEISILQDKATSNDEKFLSESYRAAAKIYTAAGQYWSISIQRASSPGQVLPVSWNIGQNLLSLSNEAYLRNVKSGGSQSKSKKQTEKK